MKQMGAMWRGGVMLFGPQQTLVLTELDGFRGKRLGCHEGSKI